MDAGADVGIPAEGGVTALHAAAELGNLQLVQLLLKVLPCLHAVTALLHDMLASFHAIAGSIYAGI